MPDRTINLDPIPRGNGSRENHGRPTMAWFFRPPSVDPSGIRLTGLPEDCFYWADAWMEHQVSVQTRKTFETVGGRTEATILVMDVDRHAGLHNGSPIVAMQQFGFGLAVAITLDATSVRIVLVPAAMALLGRANWYLPAWLEWLPTIDVDGVHDDHRRDRAVPAVPVLPQGDPAA